VTATSTTTKRAFTFHQRLTLVATSLGLFMIYLDATIVNVALPDIQADFDVGEAGLQWVVAAYSLTMGMFIMSSGTLADRLGRRRALLMGTVLFAVASAKVEGGRSDDAIRAHFRQAASQARSLCHFKSSSTNERANEVSPSALTLRYGSASLRRAS